MKAYKNLLLECFWALATTRALRYNAFYGLERLAWAKHSSLFQTLANCRRKILEHWAQATQKLVNDGTPRLKMFVRTT
jgi:hypothetical protein